MKKELKRGGIIIYKADNKIKIDVKLDQETVWLDAHKIAKLFGVNRPAIVKHINNIYKTGELSESSTCSKMEQVAADGKVRKMNLYNLDMIISVGYRVNSSRATKFRIWATDALKKYLIKGYVVNEKRLLEAQNKFKELQTAVDFLRTKSKHELMTGQEQEILNLLADYSKTLSLLEQYDAEKISLVKKGKGKFILNYAGASKIISEIKKDLQAKKEASDLFGKESSQKLQGILGNLYQTFDKKELYGSLEEKAANLFYLIIKDHPFVDGNKRIASFLFVYFLDKNNYLYKESGEKKINDNALVALALLIAVSAMPEKEKIIRIITNLLK